MSLIVLGIDRQYILCAHKYLLIAEISWNCDGILGTQNSFSEIEFRARQKIFQWQNFFFNWCVVMRLLKKVMLPYSMDLLLIWISVKLRAKAGF